MAPGSARGRRKKLERDLDRLAFLERVTRGAQPGSPAASDPTFATRTIARYTRFRHVASVLFALALLAALWGFLAVVLAVAAMAREEITFLAGASRIVGWAFGATLGYGVLKGLGEALLLWADVAELYNTSVELAWQRREEAT
jgi:hypothetical protein